MHTKTAAQISAAAKRIRETNAVMSADQFTDLLFQTVFGEYRGTEIDKRNYYLCSGHWVFGTGQASVAS